MRGAKLCSREGTACRATRPTFMRCLYLLIAAPLALSACNEADAPSDRHDATQARDASTTSEPMSAVPGDTGDMTAYDGIREDETVQFTGTEPFWGGNVNGATLTYSTPEDPEGSAIPVTRFAGRGGVSWSGTWQDRPFRLAVTEAACSDGMSDRTYPFTATLEVLAEQRQGCAWTERRSFSPPSGGN